MVLIASADKNWGIGYRGKLLCVTRADMVNLRKITMGGVLLMGGRTFRSLPNGVLEGRVNVILSRTQKAGDDGGIFVDTPEKALETIAQYSGKTCFLFGGAEVYRLFLPHCTKAFITRYNRTFTADAFLPLLDKHGWEISERSPTQEEAGIEFWFEVWRKT
ncbi:MAG: dihydrofolate reductase [Oscillospiraceae bacterium]|nr:dihydrofolate reductase [Oscillospiraceae bacterium]